MSLRWLLQGQLLWILMTMDFISPKKYHRTPSPRKVNATFLNFNMVGCVFAPSSQSTYSTWVITFAFTPAIVIRSQDVVNWMRVNIIPADDMIRIPCVPMQHQNPGRHGVLQSFRALQLHSSLVTIQKVTNVRITIFDGAFLLQLSRADGLPSIYYL